MSLSVSNCTKSEEMELTNDTFALGTSDFVNLLDGRTVYHQLTFKMR